MLVRWFIVFLLVANIILFFWIQQQSRPASGPIQLAPPEVGRLRLSGEAAEPQGTPGVGNAPPSASPPSAVERAADSAPAEPESGPSAEEAAPSEDYALSGTAPPDATPEMPIVPAEELVAPATQEAASLQPESAQLEPAAQESAVTTPAAGFTAIPVETTPEPEEAAAQTVVMEPSLPAPLELAQELCARVGPLKPEDADMLIGRLPTHIFLLSDVSEEYAQVDGYYVLIPALPSRAAGIETLKKLENAGVKDIWLFRAGELNNAISLGLFRHEESARRHADRVAKKGFTTEVRERTSTKERRWLELKNLQGGELGAGLLLPEGVTATRQPCP